MRFERRDAGRFGVAAVQLVLLVVVLAISLAGCAAPPPLVETRIQVERVRLPGGLLSCEGAPVLGDWRRQSAVADYVVRLHEAWADCSQDVAAIAQIENSAPGAPVAAK